jgi:hypothetical protein
LLTTLLFSLVSSARADSPDSHAPRAWGVSLGGAYVFHNRLPLRENTLDAPPNAGGLLGLRYGWQVAGLTGGAPTTIGFETDVMVQGTRATRMSYGLIYGVFVRHSFWGSQPIADGAGKSHQGLRPFFSYGLGAAQVWVRQVDGRGIGHATRLGLGLDVWLREHCFLTLTATYQAIMMPNFALADARPTNTSFHAGIASLGLWFGN